jgi:two-component system chemotaxis sensor kinase CheA
MKTRMQPIDHIWSKLPRVVRDLGMQLKKSIRLEMEGRETELDKTLLEAVKDPLTHPCATRSTTASRLRTPARRPASRRRAC